MSQVLLSNEQQESFRNAYLKKRKTSSCKSVKKKKKKAQRHNSKMGKRPRLYTEKFKSIHRREGIHELARITFLAYQTSKHFVGLSNKYAMLAKLFTYLFIPGVAKTFLCKYALLSLSDVECYAEKGVGQSSGSGPVWLISYAHPCPPSSLPALSWRLWVLPLGKQILHYLLRTTEMLFTSHLVTPLFGNLS